MQQDLDHVLSVLQIEGARELFAPHWDESMAAYPPEGPADFRGAAVREARTFSGLPASLDPLLDQVATQRAASPELSRLAWHQTRLLYEHLDYGTKQIASWPMPIPMLGEMSGIYILLLALDAVPRTRRVHRRLGVSASITRECFSHFGEAIWTYGELYHGAIGMTPGSLGWLRHHTKGELFRLGRHEYMVKPFAGKLTAWRHRSTGRVVALAEAGTRFAPDGFMVDNDGPESWTASLERNADAVVGTPIDPRGFARREPCTLPLSEWEVALAPGDWILEVHIPPGGNMTMDACRRSMAWAIAFFPDVFPEKPAKAFACYSWILNPELERIYRPDSNMVLWQRELYLFPTPSGKREGLGFVFGMSEVNPATARRDTSLRRALLDHLATGGRLIGGGMFMLLEDFPRFGQQVYRRA